MQDRPRSWHDQAEVGRTVPTVAGVRRLGWVWPGLGGVSRELIGVGRNLYRGSQQEVVTPTVPRASPTSHESPTRPDFREHPILVGFAPACQKRPARSI
jgi:hypothetical protein